MSAEDYRSALKMGQREYRARVSAGRYPYLQVLDESLRFAETQGEESLGLVDIPLGHIVGTRTEGRRNAFAANFMPLLEEGSEFAVKWSRLSDAHLSEGIREPIVAYEYLNRFYVQEGNKRVSVLKYYGAVSVPGTVRRILPQRQDTAESRIYFDFLDFYRQTKINYLWFSRPGRFKRLLRAVNGGEGPWSEEERSAFFAAYSRFRRLFKTLGGDRLPGTTADALLGYVDLYGYPALESSGEAELRANLDKSWNELAAYSVPEPVELELDPAKGQRSLLTKLLPGKPSQLKALFLYEKQPETSAWAHAHEEGRRGAEKALGDRVSTWYEAEVAPEKALEAITRGVEKGADVIFTTSPKLLPGCLKAAVEYPQVKILNCSVYSPHPSIRTYYGRMFEVKFLAGVVAGAMTETHRVGYMADYPIYGSIAAVNAFALGARMTDPQAQVFLEWRAQQELGLWEKLVDRGVDMISGQDLRSPVDPWRAVGLYRVRDGVGKQIAYAVWNWTRFYERILKSILEGEWRPLQEKEGPKAINYWWGLSAGVVDAAYIADMPYGVRRLTEILKEDMLSRRVHPFEGRLVRQGGQVVQEGGRLTPEEIVKMDWLEENVVGIIPPIETLTPEAQELCRVQGLDREETV